jgi:hypothetical protein
MLKLTKYLLAASGLFALASGPAFAASIVLFLPAETPMASESQANTLPTAAVPTVAATC